MLPPDTSRRDGYIPPCIPTRAYKVPAGPDWVHEIKHDGYRLQVRREGDGTASVNLALLSDGNG
jgi:ATP-dependent DNA ligase